MAKAQATEQTAPTPDKAPAPAKVAAKPGELKALFAEYESANAQVNKASDAYDKAMGARSKIVERFAAFGKVFTSPTGQQLQVASRANSETGDKSFYFRGTKEAPQKIE
jgi:hypothetical protein